MHPTPILYPVFALAGLTTIVLFWLAIVRFVSYFQSQDFVCGESDNAPILAVLANRHYVNLLELSLSF